MFFVVVKLLCCLCLHRENCRNKDIDPPTVKLLGKYMGNLCLAVEYTDIYTDTDHVGTILTFKCKT